MHSSSLKRHLFYIVITAVFLTIIPFSICKAANQGAVSSSAGSQTAENTVTYTFDKGTTVEMLQKKLDSQPHVLKVAVFRADGSQKSEGLLEDGDIVETLDEDGNVLSTVTAVIKSSGGDDSGLPSDGGDYVLDGKTTVEELSEKISAMSGYGDYEIKIKAYDKKQKQSGLVCTGDTAELLSEDGEEAGSATIIVPGDLTRCGAVTEKGCGMLYGYLACNTELSGDILRAADMNGDGTVDTRDLLMMKKQTQA